MEIINTEIVVSSLLSAGFDQVDALLYTFVLGQLSLDNRELQMFEFSDNELSALFNQFVDYNGIIFRLKDGFSLKTNVSPVEGKVLPLEKALHTSKKLIDYFSQLDYKRIVLKKYQHYMTMELIMLRCFLVKRKSQLFMKCLD